MCSEHVDGCYGKSLPKPFLAIPNVIYIYTFRRVFFMAAVSEHLSEYRHIVCYYVVLIAMSDQISSYKTWPGQDLEPYCL